MSKSKTTEQYIKNAKIIHNDSYDYSLVKYTNSRTKIKIICFEHGIFEQIANNHLQGRGCRKCNLKIKDNKSFIEESMKIHNNRYDYSNINYINNNTKIDIICKIHGIFKQKPYLHLKGRVCPKCRKYDIENIKKNFLENAKILHNDFYDYSNMDYINNKTHINIICPIHGIFKQRPDTHLQKRGCNQCGIERSKIKQSHTKEDFLKKILKIHNNRYDYSNINYIDNNTKIDIICKTHGIFKQKPYLHLQGSGCPKCKSSKGEEKIRKYLEGNNIQYKEQYSFKDLKHKYVLKCDFYLPVQNLIIEYDGIQHFKIIEHFGGRSAFMKTKHKDKLKDEYAIKNNIYLIRIPYTNFNNIEEILKNNIISI